MNSIYPSIMNKAKLSTWLLSLTLFFGLFPIASTTLDGGRQTPVKTELVVCYQASTKGTASYKIFKNGAQNSAFNTSSPSEIITRLLQQASDMKTSLAENMREILCIERPVRLLTFIYYCDRNTYGAPSFRG